jgi:protein arginine kinase activator
MMTVRCGNCGSQSATLLIRIVKDGNDPEETAVCLDCSERLERQALGAVGPLSPSALALRLVNKTEEPEFRCPSCGYDIEDLVRTGKLGCRQCYFHFSDEVLNLVQRAIGRAEHRGKTPPARTFDEPDEE